MVKIYWPKLGKELYCLAKIAMETLSWIEIMTTKVFNEVDDPCKQNIINESDLYFKIDTENVVVWVK